MTDTAPATAVGLRVFSEARRHYDRDPLYGPIGGSVASGWDDAVRELPPTTAVLAIDGPWILPWASIVTGACEAAARVGRGPTAVDVRTALLPWSSVVELTTTPMLADDPEFAPLSTRDLRDFFGPLPTIRDGRANLTIVFGPGAALVRYDELWYADLPKRYAEAEIVAGRASNLGQTASDQAGTTRRLFFIDWPVLDRHRAAIASKIDRYVDVQAEVPTSIDGQTLRETLDALARRPFRTRPTFNSTSWGGQWATQELGFAPPAGNTALGYELIAPESGLLIGEDARAAVEVPFDLLVQERPREVQGDAVFEQFGTSFPIRFDYLDTVGGGPLSVHCHPGDHDMRQVFGGAYGQHESYYVMVGGPDRVVHLGLRDDVDVTAFEVAAATAELAGEPFDVTSYVQTAPATPHQLYLIPAGTPHGSGPGNVVLEISATPYLYSLRFYDWLRQDKRGRRRRVQVGHAFRNLDTSRRGGAVARELTPSPRVVRSGPGWSEELLGQLPDLFFEIHRWAIEPGAEMTETTDRFRVFNVVEGAGIVVTTSGGGRQEFAYAETFVIPAAVARFKVEALGPVPVRLVIARVR